MVLHIFHAGYPNQCWVPAVYSLQLHVDQEAVRGSLWGDRYFQIRPSSEELRLQEESRKEDYVVVKALLWLTDRITSS